MFVCKQPPLTEAIKKRLKYNIIICITRSINTVGLLTKKGKFKQPNVIAKYVTYVFYSYIQLQY